MAFFLSITPPELKHSRRKRSRRYKQRTESFMQSEHPTLHFAFFGTPEFATIALDELEQGGYIPAIVDAATPEATGHVTVNVPPVTSLGVSLPAIPVLTPH